MMSCERKQALYDVIVQGFALDDALLYLDTHPCDEEALCYYQEQQEAYRCAKCEYIKQFGPLQLDEIAQAEQHIWITTPWPWETED